MECVDPLAGLSNSPLLGHTGTPGRRYMPRVLARPDKSIRFPGDLTQWPVREIAPDSWKRRRLAQRTTLQARSLTRRNTCGDSFLAGSRGNAKNHKHQPRGQNAL